uniref:Transcriptional regulator n=1 Tax=Desulfovibrio sp. U5L TaxID=596152 RepID=I2Q465_9BACT
MNMLDPWQLRTFLAAAAGPSFRQAAEDLAMAPSTVTTQIRSLEETLGVRLFERAGAGTVLTEHGRRLVGHARRLLDLEAEIRLGLGGEDDACPELAVRLSESLGLDLVPAVLPRFRDRFPHTRLLLATHSRQGLARDLCQGAVDLGLVLGEPFAAEGILVTEIHREELVVIAPPGSDLAGREAARPEDLAGRELFVTPHIWSARRRVENALAMAGAGPAALTECTSLAIVIRCVAAGQGLALAPRLAVRREREAGLLAVLPWAGGPLDAPVMLVRQAGRPLTRAGAAFVEAVRDVLAQEGRKEMLPAAGRG